MSYAPDKPDKQTCKQTDGLEHPSHADRRCRMGNKMHSLHATDAFNVTVNL